MFREGTIKDGDYFHTDAWTTVIPITLYGRTIGC